MDILDGWMDGWMDARVCAHMQAHMDANRNVNRFLNLYSSTVIRYLLLEVLAVLCRYLSQMSANFSQLSWLRYISGFDREERKIRQSFLTAGCQGDGLTVSNVANIEPKINGYIHRKSFVAS